MDARTGPRVVVVAIVMLSAETVAAQAFDPAIDGFGFQNYTNEIAPVNLTGAELHRMFGDAVCAVGSGADCALTPQADQWLEATSEQMGGGHCEGMAVQALRLYRGDDDVNAYGAGSTVMLAIDGNEALQREIGYWWALQGIEEVHAGTVRGTPSEIVAALRASFETGGDAHTIGFYKRDMTGGHAVTPIGIEDIDADHVQILVYDNNFPGETRPIEVDLAAETWTYSAAASPDIPESLYEGDAETRTLQITPLGARTGVLTCPFCGEYAPSRSATRYVSVTGTARVLIQDEVGNQLGHLADGTFIEGIPGAEVYPSRSDDLWADQAEPSYGLPGGLVFDVFVGDAGGGVGESSLGVTSEGYYLGVEGIALDVGQEDVAYFDADTAYVGYETEGLETPDVVLAAQTAGADWVFAVRSRGDSGGQRIDAALDFDAGILEVAFTGTDAESEFDLLAARTDDTSEIEFASDMLRVPNGAILAIHFGGFDTDGEALPMTIDVDADGTMDDSVDVVDTGDGDLGPGPGASPPPPPPPAGGGCVVATPRTGPSGALAFLAVVLVAARRRRRVPS